MNRDWFCLILCSLILLCPDLWAQNLDGTAAKRTDSFETKMKLLQEAWEHKDYELARSLTHSLRDTVIQTQAEEQSPAASLLDVSQFRPVSSLGEAATKWARGWKYFKPVAIKEPIGEARTSEPIEISLSFSADQATSLAREIRVVRVDAGSLIEIPSQVYGEVRRQQVRSGKVTWLVDSQPNETQLFLVLYGNPDAELPEYPSDLVTQGEGVALDISNSVFKASLSRQTGQLERMTLRREHGLELFSGGQGHGEPPGIDWAHDYVDWDGFQKLRISLWDTCPDFEVVRGPVCTIVRRWGFPRSPIHPTFSPSRLNVYVEYRFYAGLPWFYKMGSMKAIQDFEAPALRDDEWVFSGQSFTDSMWMGRDGKLKLGDVPRDQQEDIWGVGFCHKVSKDSFMALFLEHKATGLPELKHTGVPQSFYRWHGPVWSRYPLPVKNIPKGAVLEQRNAYVTIPYTEPEYPATIERLRRCLLSPLVASAATDADLQTPVSQISKPAKPNPSDRLARLGEAGDATISKAEIWKALRDSKDAQLYTADINVVDLGLVYDVRVRADTVTVVMAMPHRGRPLLGYFIDGSISVHPTYSRPVRERLMMVPGVKRVVVEQTWYPGWNTNRLSDEGRKRLGLN